MYEKAPKFQTLCKRKHRYTETVVHFVFADKISRRQLIIYHLSFSMHFGMENLLYSENCTTCKRLNLFGKGSLLIKDSLSHTSRKKDEEEIFMSLLFDYKLKFNLKNKHLKENDRNFLIWICCAQKFLSLLLHCIVFNSFWLKYKSFVLSLCYCLLIYVYHVVSLAFICHISKLYGKILILNFNWVL